ncbi:LamG domain-containing protein [Candidatus Roizmanbacteria bacterium]|nr:LamG domain-containing protein [Candidatus Roizmanbacteria bacterium]
MGYLHKAHVRTPIGSLLLISVLTFCLVLIATEKDKTPQALTLAQFTPPESGFVIDHTSLELFDQIPSEYLSAGQNLSIMWADRSVGANISEGMSCLANLHSSAPNHCKRTNHNVDAAFSVDPSEVFWSGTYPRDNFDYFGWPGTNIPPELPCGVNATSWYQKLDCFIQYVDANADLYEVFSYQNSYLEVDTGSTIANPIDGYFIPNQPNRMDISDFEALENRHPTKTFIHWTSSLARSIGKQESTDFNSQMRQYAITNNKILFDVADIESHDPAGNSCYDNRDGVPYSSENHADDGFDYPAICPHYTTETDGGHLGSVSAGKIRIAKAYWVLLARLAGWNPDGSVSPTPTIGIGSTAPTMTPTLIPTATLTPTPTSPFIPTNTPPPGGNELVHWNFMTNSANNTSGGCSSCEINGATWNSVGKLNGGFDFDGTNDYLNLSSFSFLDNTAAFSLTVWVKPNFDQTHSTTRYVLSNNGLQLFYLSNINDWRVSLRTTTGTIRLDTQNLTWTTGTWHHLGVTYDGTNAKLYWDGSLVASSPYSGTVYPIGANTSLGSSVVSSNYFPGSIDEVRVVTNAALSPEEIQSLALE